MRTLLPILLAVAFLPFFTGCTSVKQDFRKNLIRLDRSIQDMNQYLRPQPMSAASSSSARSINWKEVSTDNLANLSEADMQAEWLGGLVPDSDFKAQISAAGVADAERQEELVNELTASTETYDGSFAPSISSFDGGEIFNGTTTTDTSIPMYSGSTDGGYSTYDNYGDNAYSTPTYDTYSTGVSTSYDSIPMYSESGGDSSISTYSPPSTYSQPVYSQPEYSQPVYSAPAPVYSAPAPVYAPPPTTFVAPAVSSQPSVIPSYQSQPSYRLERRPAQGNGTLYRNQFGTEIYQ